MKKRNLRNFINGKGFYILLSLCFAVIIISAGVITVNNTNKLNENQQDIIGEEYIPQEVEPIVENDLTSEIESQQPTINVADTNNNRNRENIDNILGIGLSEENSLDATIENVVVVDEEEVIDTIEIISQNNIETSEQVAEVEEVKEVAEINEVKEEKPVVAEQPIVKQVFFSFNNDSKMIWPVDGEVVMDYSKNHTIYDKTLEQYRVNESISIGASVGTQVKAAATGTVVSIKKDNKNGNTIVLDHGNGWQTTYSQLQDDIVVKENDIVEEGDIIGGIAEPTKYGVALGGHLNFEVKKDGSTVDPKSILK